jgi:hypothetical protein
MYACYALNPRKSMMLADFPGRVPFMHSFLCCIQLFKPVFAIEPTDWTEPPKAIDHDDDDDWVSDTAWGHYDVELDEWIQL